MVFVSSGTTALVEIKTVGEFKRYFVDRLKSILSLTVQNTSRLDSPISGWPKGRIKTAMERA
jgi:hypothetical protein